MESFLDRAKSMARSDAALSGFVAAAKVARLPVEAVIRRASQVGDSTFFDPSMLPWAADMESAWPMIRAELDELLASGTHIPELSDLSVRQKRLVTGPGWKTYFFRAYGRRADANCARCPQTAAVIDANPTITTAFFSILDPGTELIEHRGPWKGILRYHLAVKVPEPAEACGIRVGDEVRHWHEGASMVFDDTFPHSAWNRSQEPRVVLFIDFKRPLRAPLGALNNAVIGAVGASPYVQHALERFERMQAQAERADQGGL